MSLRQPLVSYMCGVYTKKSRVACASRDTENSLKRISDRYGDTIFSMQNSGDMVKANNFFPKGVNLLIKKFYTVPSPFPFFLKNKIKNKKFSPRKGKKERLDMPS